MKLIEKDFSLISIGEDKYLCHLRNILITIGEREFNGLTVIFRLLTVDELKIADRLIPSTADPVGNANAISLEVEEDIFNKCVYHIFGLESKSEIDLDTVEAGVISTIAGLILRRSYEHIERFEYFLQAYVGSINMFDQLKLVIVRYYNISYKEVCALPIDELVKKYVVLRATFPDVPDFTKKEDEQPQDND